MSPAASCLKRVDLNEVLSYSTPRLARIRDWRLGALSMILTLGIFAYVILWTVVFAQRYRRLALDVVGSTRLQLRPPTAAYWLEPAATAYCGVGPGVGPDGFVFPRFPCRYIDAYDAVQPFLEPGALFMSSRISETNYSLPADCEAQLTPSCAFAASAPTSTFFVGNLEMFTLLIDHTFSSASLNLQQAASSMPGRLVDASGAVLNACDDYTQQGWPCPAVISVGAVGGSADIVPLRTLLRAAGIASLDAQAGGLNESFRYGGLVLVLSVEYSNFWLDTSSFSEARFTYTYSVRAVANAEFKAEQSSSAGALNRTILDRHGLRLLVKQSGTIGAFDSSTLLIALTSGLGLLAVTTLVVDFVATRILALRGIYASYKTWSSEDAATLQALSADALQQAALDDVVNPQPPFVRGMREQSQRSRLLPKMGAAAVAGAPRERAGSGDGDDSMKAALLGP